MKKNENTCNSQNIALTGLMGSGKSSVGRTIARKLKKKFIDTDYLIEKKEGKKIKDIFTDKGEEYFRKLESQVIKNAFSESGVVISLGGGAVVNDDNRKYIKDNSTLVTLIAQPKDLYERVKRRKTRPLLNEAQDQLEVLKGLWEERKEAYYDSHLQIETSGQEIDDIADLIISKLGHQKVSSHVLNINIPRDNFKYKINFRKIHKLNLAELNIGNKVLIVTQEPIAKEYLDTVKKLLGPHFKIHTIVIENGEQAKNFFTFQLILQKCLAKKLERNDTLIALGGGVVGDITGFAASAYLRGINYIQIPTTFLSMIDSAVGGKTGINVDEGKNLIGAFYQPAMVHIDVDFLNTLPEKEFKSGLGELVKYALLGSKWDLHLGESFFGFISRNSKLILNKNYEILRDTIEHCLQIKTNIVTEDEKEKGLRAHLNLGHTFGHAIEEATQYSKFSHGEAVAIGTVCACYLAEELKIFKKSETGRVIKLMEDLGLEYKVPSDLNADDLIKAMGHDKKVQDGKIRFIVPKAKIGRVEIVSDISPNLIKAAIERNQ